MTRQPPDARRPNPAADHHDRGRDLRLLLVAQQLPDAHDPEPEPLPQMIVDTAGISATLNELGLVSSRGLWYSVLSGAP